MGSRGSLKSLIKIMEIKVLNCLKFTINLLSVLHLQRVHLRLMEKLPCAYRKTCNCLINLVLDNEIQPLIYLCHVYTGVWLRVIKEGQDDVKALSSAKVAS